MKVNSAKTAMLCVSDSLAAQSESFIVGGDGEEVWLGEGMKMLGFHFGQRPTVAAHVGLEAEVQAEDVDHDAPTTRRFI